MFYHQGKVLFSFQIYFIMLITTCAGLNIRESYDWVFDNPSGNLMDELLELKKEGKIRHIGFSTHGSAPTIGKMIESNQFDYVNLHYHFCGSSFLIFTNKVVMQY